VRPLQNIYFLKFALGVTAAFICIGYGLATGTIYHNLVLDPSVESGASAPNYWVPSKNGTEWSLTYAKTGVRSIRVNVTNASAEWKSKVATVHEGSTYEVHGFFRGQVLSNQFYLAVRWFSGLGGLSPIAENNVSIPVGDSSYWSQMGSVFTAPAGAQGCEIVFGAVNGSGDVYGDDFEVRQTESLTKLMNGLSIALITYIVSYYIIKRKFMLKVEKPQKLLTMGIGVYFLAWLLFWILLYTLIAGA